jgi:hypothetical protein
MREMVSLSLTGEQGRGKGKGEDIEKTPIPQALGEARPPHRTLPFPLREQTRWRNKAFASATTPDQVRAGPGLVRQTLNASADHQRLMGFLYPDSRHVACPDTNAGWSKPGGFVIGPELPIGRDLIRRGFRLSFNP